MHLHKIVVIDGSHDLVIFINQMVLPYSLESDSDAKEQDVCDSVEYHVVALRQEVLFGKTELIGEPSDKHGSSSNDAVAAEDAG